MAYTTATNVSPPDSSRFVLANSSAAACKPSCEDLSIEGFSTRSESAALTILIATRFAQAHQLSAILAAAHISVQMRFSVATGSSFTLFLTN
jgi:hypothetical protein